MADRLIAGIRDAVVGSDSDSSETSPLPQSELDQVRRDASTIANPEPEILEFAHFGLGSTTPRYCRGTSAR